MKRFPSSIDYSTFEEDHVFNILPDVALRSCQVLSSLLSASMEGETNDEPC